MKSVRFEERRRGFTIVELLVVVSIIALLIAILLPAIGKARDAARITQSQGNMRNLAVSNDTYASDWADRQFTACPDDVGIVGGNGVAYGEQIGCMGQMLTGYDANGALWGCGAADRSAVPATPAAPATGPRASRTASSRRARATRTSVRSAFPASRRSTPTSATAGTTRSSGPRRT